VKLGAQVIDPAPNLAEARNAFEDFSPALAGGLFVGGPVVEVRSTGAVEYSELATLMASADRNRHEIPFIPVGRDVRPRLKNVLPLVEHLRAA